MKQEFWAIIGVGIALFVGLGGLMGIGYASIWDDMRQFRVELSTLEERMTDRMTRTEERMDDRLGRMEKRISERFDGIEERISVRFDRTDERINANGTSLASLETRIDGVDRSLDRIEARLGIPVLQEE